MTKAILRAVLAMLGLGGSALPVVAGPSLVPTDLTDKLWVAAGTGGTDATSRVFRSNGTLVRESAGGSLHVQRWEPLGANRLYWLEDGIEVSAEIEHLSATDLILRLDVISGPVTQHYVAGDPTDRSDLV